MSLSAMTPELAALTTSLSASAGEARWFLGELALIKLTGAMTGGRLAVVEFTGLRGSQTPGHTHRREDEVFILLEGAMRFQVGEATLDVTPGHVVLAPKAIPHGYVVLSETARWLVMTFPAGFEDFVREASAPARELRVPRPGEPQGDESKLLEIAARHEIDFA